MMASSEYAMIAAMRLGGLKGLSLLGRVSVDRTRADDDAVLFADRRHGDRDRDHRSVLLDTYSLEAFDGLTILDPGQDVVDLAGSIFGVQEAAGPADDLFAGVAVQSLGGRVPARDDALERAANDGIVRVLDDGGHELGVLDRRLLFGHVAHRRDDQQDVPGVNVGQADVDWGLGAVPLPSDQFQLESTRASPGVCKVVLPVLRVDLLKRLGY